MPTTHNSRTYVLPVTRRRFLQILAACSAGTLAGCAVNPVTGQSQLMLVSREQEIAMDKKSSPHQFSADYGAAQDTELNTYVEEVGLKLAANSHRPDMPYSFRCVNAAYVNAYAFPGGSIACTRGIMLGMESEASLAALLGHEIGHVNARHTASRMSKNVVLGALVAGTVGVLALTNEDWTPIAAGLGGIAAGALLASYSRDDERQADELGMEYAVRTGYSPKGTVELMELLQSLHEGEPSALQRMFASHPMSSERLATAKARLESEYPDVNLPLYHERYMDRTVNLRAIRTTIEELQKGEKLLTTDKFQEADEHFRAALKQSPDDYAALLMEAKCLLAQDKTTEAARYAEAAREAYPQEAQALHIHGMTALLNKQYDAAYTDFAEYEKRLPGNPVSAFFQGYALDEMGRRQQAAEQYKRYLRQVNQGAQAEYAYKRLVEMGQIRSDLPLKDLAARIVLLGYA